MAGPYRGDATGPCPVERAADILGDRWTLLLLRESLAGVSRYNDFKKILGISDVSLENRLNRMVSDGLLVKVPYPPSARRPEYRRREYRLTRAGADVLGVVHAMMRWAEEHTRPAQAGGSMRLVHSSCGGDIEPGRSCPSCGEEVPRTDMAWIQPWRRDEAQQLAGAIQ